MSKNIVIGILAYNVSTYIEDVITEISELGVDFFVINDFSNDDTMKKLIDLKKNINFEIVENKVNLGAGESTKVLIKKAYDKGYDFFIKVDGDGQFNISDIKRIVELYHLNKFSFIKSNRFWEGGIVGKIPKKRLFGNLFATILLQLTTGTNKVFDPLNGLFGVSTEIIYKLNRFYPKRYGYPFYITVVAIINSYKTFQINNVVTYGDQKSKLNPIKVLIILLRLFLYFYLKKIKIKKNIGKFQRSAFFDVLFLISLCINLYLLIEIFLVLNNIRILLISPTSLLFLFLILTFTSITLFTLSFREEKSIRNKYISTEI